MKQKEDVYTMEIPQFIVERPRRGRPRKPNALTGQERTALSRLKNDKRQYFNVFKNLTTLKNLQQKGVDVKPFISPYYHKLLESENV